MGAAPLLAADWCHSNVSGSILAGEFRSAAGPINRRVVLLEKNRFFILFRCDINSARAAVWSRHFDRRMITISFCRQLVDS